MIKKRKTTRADLRRHAKKFGAEIEVNVDMRDCLDVELIAPDGYHWEGEDVHALVGHDSDGRYRHEVYDDLIDRATGIEPCSRDNVNCCDWHDWPRPQ